MSAGRESMAPSRSGLTEWTLLVQQPGRQQQEYFLQHGLTLGRNPSNTIAIDHPDVERIHARIHRPPDGSLVVKTEADHARLLLPDGRAVSHVVLAPDTSFKIGPAIITCSQRKKPTVVVARHPWQVQCPRCQASLAALPKSSRQEADAGLRPPAETAPVA